MFKRCLFAMLLLAHTSSAQTTGLASGYPVERFRMTPDRTAVLDVEFGRVLNHLDFDLGLYVGGANDPLVLYKTATGERVGRVVTDRIAGGFVSSGPTRYSKRYA
jgi:hypothetical protein